MYWVSPCCVEQRNEALLVPATYIWQADLSVPLHGSFQLLQASVVPARELEAQGPVWRDEGSANQLDTHEILLDTLNITEVFQANFRASFRLFNFIDELPHTCSNE